MKHIQDFERFLNEGINKSLLRDEINQIVDDYGGFDDWSIEISDSGNLITVFHSKVDSKYFSELENELIPTILDVLFGRWEYVEQTPKYFMLANR